MTLKDPRGTGQGITCQPNASDPQPVSNPVPDATIFSHRGAKVWPGMAATAPRRHGPASCNAESVDMSPPESSMQQNEVAKAQAK